MTRVRRRVTARIPRYGLSGLAVLPRMPRLCRPVSGTRVIPSFRVLLVALVALVALVVLVVLVVLRSSIDHGRGQGV